MQTQTQTHPRPASRQTRRLRRLFAPALAASMIASLAAIPTGSALAATPVEGTVPTLTSLSLPNGVLTPAETQRVVEELLGKLPAGEVTALESKLGVGPLPTSELASDVASLLKNGSPAAVEPVVGELFGTLGFQSTTLGALAEKLGLPIGTLASELGASANPAAQVLSAPLGSHTFRTVVDGPEGLKVTTLETRESSKTGAGSTTVIPGTPAAPRTAPPASKTVVKIRILSHTVKGKVATLVLQIPVAGKVVVSGGGVKGIAKKATRSERLTVRVHLSKAGTASLHKHHKHHNRLKVSLRASFKPASGPSSSASATVRFA